MTDEEWLAARFEASRSRLRAVAYRILGSLSEAEDALQEAWIHAAGGDADAVANLDGWLTTIVARVCLDMLRSRKSRREQPLSPAEVAGADGATMAAMFGEPEQEAVLADSVGLALLVVLDTLSPAERVAFVLHDMFALPFEDIGAATGRTPAAARQLASRARRRVQGAPAVPDADLARRREVAAGRRPERQAARGPRRRSRRQGRSRRGRFPGSACQSGPGERQSRGRAGPARAPGAGAGVHHPGRQDHPDRCDIRPG
jgi:RNA polymerase sigma-70 factor (ECF subfamily)